MTTNNTPSVPQQNGIRQAAMKLRDIEDSMRYTPALIGYAAALNVEKIAHILAGALVEIDARLADLEHREANRISRARLEEDQPGKRFPDLDSLVKTHCAMCGADWEVLPCIPPDAQHYARCSNTRCEGCHLIYPVSRRVAMEWEDMAHAEDLAYREREEESSG
ncbi:MAG: hypothetical protein HYY29_03515 [Chloroflexi bacterium]|nr:hypothetical protein [Chloroflexota bacterium]